MLSCLELSGYMAMQLLRQICEASFGLTLETMDSGAEEDIDKTFQIGGFYGLTARFDPKTLPTVDF